MLASPFKANPYLNRRFAPWHPPEPDWDNPVTRGMFFCISGTSTWLERNGASRVVRDCVSGQLGGDVSAPASISRVVGLAPNGAGYQYAGAGTRASSTLDFQFLPPQSAVMHIVPATWVFVAQFDSLTHQSLACRSSGIAHSQGWNIGLSLGNWGLNLQRATTDVRVSVDGGGAGAAWPTGIGQSIVITHDGSNTGANGRIFANGKRYPQGGGTANGVGGSATAAAQSLQFGNTQQIPADGFIGSLYLAALFSRQMGDQEARDVSSNPWQLVKQLRYPRLAL